MPSDNGRQRVLVVDRVGYDRYRMPDGSPALNPDAYHVTLLAPPAAARQTKNGECEEVFAFDIENPEFTSAMIETVNQRDQIDRAIVFPESLQLPVAELRDKLGIAGPGVTEVLPFRDKLIMKETAARGSLPVADYIPIDTAGDVTRFLAKYGRVFLKPRKGTGSAGTYPVACQADLDALASDPAVDLSDYQAERYVDAPMVHIDAVVLGGRPVATVTSRYLSSTLSHLTSQPLSSVAVSDRSLLRQADGLLNGVIRAFSAINAVLHLEAFVDKELIFNEVACRPGGGGIVAAVQALSGYNLFESMIRMSLGESPTSAYEVTADCAGFLMLYGKRAIFSGIDDGDIPADWIIERKVAVRPGEYYSPVGRAGGSFATYVVRGRSEEQVRHRLSTIQKVIRIRFTGGPAAG